MLIRNAKVYTMENGVIENCDILIKGKKFEKIGKNLQCEDGEVIDATGKIVIPGIVDPHCHIGMWEDGMDFEGADGNEYIDPVTPSLRAIDAINPMDRCFEEAYKGGVTTVVTGPGSANVIGGIFSAIKTCGDRIDDMIVKEECALKVAFGENPKRVYSEQKKTPTTRMATANILRKQLVKAQNYLNKIENAKGDKTKIPDRDLDMEILGKVLKREVMVKAHAHRADDILTAIRIAKEFNIIMSVDHCTEGHLIPNYLKEKNLTVIIGPIVTERCKIELKNLTLKAASILNENGIEFGLCTDHPVVAEQNIVMCASLAAREGLPYEKALEAITINAAKAVHIDDKVGSIKEGKDADLVIYGGDPLDIRNKPKTVIIDGKIVFAE
jgi:imidazolonepropionase-like amidohydrolase